MKVGIAGGIGSGKSYVCRRLSNHGIDVYDCDSAAKRLMRSAEIQSQLEQLIGCRPDKQALTRFLLASDDNAHAINAIVHPAVFRDFEESGKEWLESGIMYESGADHYVDFVVVVTAPEDVRQLADFEIVNDGQTDLDPQIDNLLTQLTIGTHQKTTLPKNKTTMQQTILAISGKPGLYKLLTRGNKNLIVESLDASHRRMPAFATDRITSLADIAMYTETEDVPLMTILENMKKLEDGKKASIDFKKASANELHEYFTKVLPEWDRDRVKNSHIQKLIQWYNILIEAGITDFEEEMKPTEGDNIDDRKEQE